MDMYNGGMGVVPFSADCAGHEQQRLLALRIDSHLDVLALFPIYSSTEGACLSVSARDHAGCYSPISNCDLGVSKIQSFGDGEAGKSHASSVLMSCDL